jgi:Immunity protein 30
MTNAELIATLVRHRLMQSTEDTMTFDRAVQQLAEHPKGSDLPALLRVFDDGTEHIEVMWTLVHLVEGYDAAEYAGAFVAVLPEALPSARDWMEALALGQLNDDEARGLLLDAARRTNPSARQALSGLLAQIAATQDDQVAARARDVLSDLGRA